MNDNLDQFIRKIRKGDRYPPGRLSDHDLDDLAFAVELAAICERRPLSGEERDEVDKLMQNWKETHRGDI